MNQMKVEDLQIQRNVHLSGPGRIAPAKISNLPESAAGDTAKQIGNFADILAHKIDENGGVKFSAHALQRISEREINLSVSDLDRIEQGLKNVEEKGARSSLLLLDDTAYIVSVNNRTVITAMSKEQTIGNVFTNIDSVAIV